MTKQYTPIEILIWFSSAEQYRALRAASSMPYPVRTASRLPRYWMRSRPSDSCENVEERIACARQVGVQMASDRRCGRDDDRIGHHRVGGARAVARPDSGARTARTAPRPSASETWR